MLNKKRLFKEDKRDVKKIKACHSTEVSTKNHVEGNYKEETLAEEYQPQFLNYMLIGDLVAIMILNSKNLIYKTKSSRPVLYQNFCHSAWSVRDISDELKSKKKCYPIAKSVILSVGYNDYCGNLSSVPMLAEGIEKIIQKLQRRGCKDIILTNVPPSLAKSTSVEHWKYLQVINNEILRLSEKYAFIGHCNIFKLFCTPKNYFSSNKEYVTFGEINYKIDAELFNENKNDLISFSDLGKTVLGKYIAKTIENRLEFLRCGRVNNVLCSLKISDSEDVEDVDVKKNDDIIDVDSEEDEKKNVNHIFGCKCKTCEEEDLQLMKEMLSTIE